MEIMTGSAPNMSQRWKFKSCTHFGCTAVVRSNGKTVSLLLFFSLSTTSKVIKAFFISLSIISNFVARYLVWLRMCFTLRAGWCRVDLLDSLRIVSVIKPLYTQPGPNPLTTQPHPVIATLESLQTRPFSFLDLFSPHKTIWIKIVPFFSWDTRSRYVCWVVVIDLNQTEALCNWEWETFGSRSFCKKKEEKNTFYICFTSEYILVGTLKVDRAGLFNNQNVYSGDLDPPLPRPEGRCQNI